MVLLTGAAAPMPARSGIECSRASRARRVERHGKVILPFTVLRRLDCALELSKGAVLAEKQLREGQGLYPEPFLLQVDKLDMAGLL
jgi:type I restriction-modification system DNA methylase subunit